MGGRVQEGEQYLESQMQPDDNSATEAGGEPVQLEEGTAAAAAVTKERTKRKVCVCVCVCLCMCVLCVCVCDVCILYIGYIC